jgi:hypothetical protein
MIATALFLTLAAVLPATSVCGTGANADAQYQGAFAVAIVRVVSTQLETGPHVYIDETASLKFEGPISVLVAKAEVVEQLKGEFSGAVSITVPGPGHKCHSFIEVGESYIVFSPGLWGEISPNGPPLLLQQVPHDKLSQWRNEP